MEAGKRAHSEHSAGCCEQGHIEEEEAEIVDQ